MIDIFQLHIRNVILHVKNEIFSQQILVKRLLIVGIFPVKLDSVTGLLRQHIIKGLNKIFGIMLGIFSGMHAMISLACYHANLNTC